MGTFDRIGFNLRLSDIQAAVGVAQMGKLQKLVADRRATAQRYTKMLCSLNDLILPDKTGMEGHTFQSYVVRLAEGGRKRRNAIMAAMALAEIQTRPGTHAVHRLGYYREKYGLKAEQFPNACIAEDTTITLPIIPFMRESDQEQVVDILRRALKL
jgi:dTDP-4-amino-4,6-dideoxygalactose transaminase